MRLTHCIIMLLLFEFLYLTKQSSPTVSCQGSDGKGKITIYLQSKYNIIVDRYNEERRSYPASNFSHHISNKSCVVQPVVSIWEIELMILLDTATGHVLESADGCDGRKIMWLCKAVNGLENPDNYSGTYFLCGVRTIGQRYLSKWYNIPSHTASVIHLHRQK